MREADQPAARLDRRGVEAATVVPHLEPELARRLPDGGSDRRVAPRVLRRVLDRLERCEVDRRLDRLRIARETVDSQRRSRVASNRLRERGAQAEVGQDRWIGAVGDLSDLVERPVDLLSQPRQLGVGRRRLPAAGPGAGARGPCRSRPAAAGRRRADHARFAGARRPSAPAAPSRRGGARLRGVACGGSA